MRTLKQALKMRFLLWAALPVLLFIACHLGDEEKVEATISFNQIYDSLVQYDSVLITLKDKDGSTIDVVFRGKVDEPGDVENRPAPHWKGGDIIVSIVGYKGGVVAYRSESKFNGATNKKDSVYVFVSPDVGISYGQSSIPMLEGDSIDLPSIVVTPANLKSKELKWVSSAPDVVRIGATGFKALKAGNTQITISLVADPGKSFVIAVTVVDPAKIPESLSLSADTLKLSAGGAPGSLVAQFVPTTSAKDLTWSILDTSIAGVGADGMVKGLKAGETRLVAISSIKASVSDTAVVTVTSPKLPERVVFAKAETEIFIGGAAESLLVSIFPPEANQEVVFTASAPLLIDLKNGRISGLSAGEGEVIALSKVNPLLADTLKVKITLKQVVSSVTLNKKSLTLFTGGDEVVLAAAIEPSTSNQKVQWRADQPGIAKVSDVGKVTGLSPGHTLIHAISLVDSTKQDSANVTVKTDAPVVNIGRPDTTVSVGAAVTFLPVVPVQEFGVVVAFRWDVDGVAGWEDTAKAVQGVTVKFDQEKDYSLRFYVRDTEGNETIATKKVSAVIGPVVTIVSPLNGQSFNTPGIKVEWTINNIVQTTFTDASLKEGLNTITRTAKDAAGKEFSANVTVYLDQAPPSKPLVKGPASSTTGKPTWTWAPGGGGNGAYRIALDSEVFAGPEIKDTLYIPEPALSEGSHTLFVQERDAAGNWSQAGKVVTVVDRTGPSKPIVKTSVPSPSNTKKPTWTWSTGGGAGSGIFQHKYNSSDFAAGASTPSTDTLYIPSANLGDGLHTLYVRERDSLGNWSELGNASITLDTTAPGAPNIDATSPTSGSPTWTWSSGGGGSGNYRFKVGGEPTTSPETNLLKHVLAGAVTKTTYILYVQERDAVGNWSPVSNKSVFYDQSKPGVTITSPLAQSAGTFMTKSATVELKGTTTPGTGAVKSVTYTVDGVAGILSTNLAGDGSWSINPLPLVNNKTIVVKVTAKDAAENAGDATLSILMDNTAPVAPGFTSQPPATVNKQNEPASLDWAWNTPVGTDSFVVKLNGVDVARQTGASYSVSGFTDKTYKLEVSGKDLTGNASGFTASATVLADRVSPNAPSLSQPATPRRTAVWTWEGGGGGNGTFQCKLDDAAIPSTCTSPNTLINPKDGVHTLQVRELDAAGNPSGYASTTVTIDLQDPILTRSNYLTTPSQIANSFSAFTGNATDDRGLKSVKYRVGSGALKTATGTSSWSFPAIADTGTVSITVIVEDQADNADSTTFKISHQPNVIFVRQGASASGDGSSWEKAYPELGPLLRTGKTYKANTQFWVTEGSYSPQVTDGFILRSNSSVIGGFAGEGTDRSLADRNTLQNISTLTPYSNGKFVVGNTDQPLNTDNLMLSDFRIIETEYPLMFTSATKLVLNKITLNNGKVTAGVSLFKTTADIISCDFSSGINSEGMLQTSGEGYVRIKDSKIMFNTSGSDPAGGITINGGGEICASGSTEISGNTSSEVWIFSGSFKRELTTILGGNGIIGGEDKIEGCRNPF